nr:ABC transporter ATP-binding protein [Noviherbaspirillum massiliense]
MVEVDFAIRVSNLSKRYQIYDTPRDRLKQFVAPRLQRLIGGTPKQYYREFWALKEVSFEIKRGQALGILGRNGAGKSTLLQILCGTLTPTSGTVEVNGRIAALLELGAGFNPEFTGRENVFMNASVLGLSQKEIEARFDDIVAFADIGNFLEQPVKTYSSGMFVRLAFAIAVHIEPDILVVDEALSVGDIAFRNKCILKIKELRERGTTLLFVSHDLSTLQMICDYVIWLNAGKVKAMGHPIHVCSEFYISMIGSESEQNNKSDIIKQQNTEMARFTECALARPSNGESAIYTVGEKMKFNFALEALQNLDEVIFAISVYRNDGDWLIGQTSRECGVFWPAVRGGDVVRGELVFTPICFAPGDYMVALGAYSKDHSICYAVTDLTVYFSVRSSFPTWGKFIHPCEWIVGGGKCLPH